MIYLKQNWFGNKNLYKIIKYFLLILLFYFYIVMLYLKIKHLSKTQENMDIFSKNDMFVEIIYGNKIRRTMTLWNNNEPVWDETFLFPTLNEIGFSTKNTLPSIIKTGSSGAKIHLDEFL